MTNRMIETDFNVLILAAGMSKRFGKAKAFLPFDGKHLFIDQILLRFHDFGASKIVVVTNESLSEAVEERLRLLDFEVLTVVNKLFPDQRFHSIQTGLEHFKEKIPVFIHNVDNPFVNQETVKKLLFSLQNKDWVRPVFEKKGGHPTLLSYKLIDPIIDYKDVRINLRRFLEAFSFADIEVDDSDVLRNVNDIKEYQKYFNVQ